MIELFLQTNGKSCAADIAVSHALQPNKIFYAARESAGAVTRYAIMVKDKKYKAVLEKQDHGIDYLPLVGLFRSMGSASH